MADTPLTIAIVGAGLGGLTAASTLGRCGFDVRVYEQASRCARIGTGIQMMPNSMKVLRQIGIEERVRATSFEPYSQPRTSRIQAISSANTWMRGGNDDTSWLYGYDAWNVPLNELALNPAS